jgi:dihydrofolate reductase
MARVRVHNLAMSLDGYVAGPDQSVEHPLGVDGELLHEWMFRTRTWCQVVGEDGGETGIDDEFMARGLQNIGATIMGRNMFGPIRGSWGDTDWRGWWGDEPPYHHPVFVLTHHERDPISMEGGTTFHFVTDGIESALRQALDAAEGRDVRIGGGATAVQQYMGAGLIDELHVPIVPILLGGGARLFDNLDGGMGDYECVEFVSSPSVAHARIERRK